jgi:hypothetical protein
LIEDQFESEYDFFIKGLGMTKSKQLLFAFFAFIFAIEIASAQEYAVTETGDTIIIFMDGTWTYADGTVSNLFNFEIKFDTSDQEYTVLPSAHKTIKSDLEFFKVLYDPNTWKRIPPGELNDEAEMAFEGNGFDAYGVVISEEVEIGSENIFKIAMDNMAEFLGSQPEVLTAEIRKVNGTELILGIFKLEFEGMKITYQAYYYSSPKGTVQFTTWTGSNVYEKYSSKLDELLNGLIID